MSETAQEQVDTQAIAEMVIYELLGRRAAWPPKRVVEVYPIARDLNLTGRPVQEVESIVDHDGNEVTDWALHSKFRIRLPRRIVDKALRRPRPSWPEYYGEYVEACHPAVVTVTYVYGYSQPPSAVQYAIDEYKKQLDLAIAGDSNCQLPKRVTSISRQGISMTILDPAEYIDKGRTGVPQIDSMLAFMNPTGAKRRARLFTEKNPPPRRLQVEVVEEDS